jgi:hemolysin activation/secretion protein
LRNARKGLAILLCAVPFALASAQDSPRRPDYEEPRLKRESADVLPPVAAPLPQRSLAGSVSVFVREIVLVDGSVFSRLELEPVFAPYLNRQLTNEHLQELRQRLSLLYFDAGYVNSGVILPDQEVADGRIVFREVRGRLTGIEIQGNKHLRDLRSPST